MIIMIICFALLFASINLINTNKLNRALDDSFALMNMTLPRSWVVFDAEEPLTQPMYDTYLVETTSIEHFKNNLKGTINEIKVGFYYFDEETLEQKTDRYVTGVRVSLKAKLNDVKHYYRATDYTISRMNHD